MSPKKTKGFLSTIRNKMRSRPASRSGSRSASPQQTAPASTSSLSKVSGQPMDSPSAQLPSAVSSAASVSPTPMQATPAPDTAAPVTPTPDTPASATPAPTPDTPTQHDPAPHTHPPDPTLLPSSTSTPPQAANKVFFDGLQEVFKIAKESADWSPFAKAAFGGAAAVLDLLKKTKANKQEVKYLSSQIERLESILSRRMKAGLLSAEWCIESIQKCVNTLKREEAILKDMETHGRFRKTLQATSDGDDLLDVCRRIKDCFEELQCTVGLSIEHDTSTIRQNSALDKLPIAVTAPHNAAIGDTGSSREACTKDTRFTVIKPILRWIAGHDRASVYWLTGPAGVGKTTIAQTMCRYIVSPTGEHEDEAAAKDLRERRLISFFCSHQLDSGEAKRLVPTLCRRLAEHSSSYARELVRALERDSTLPHAELPTQLEGLLIKPWESSTAQSEGLPLPVVVVDALDENKGGFKFLDLLLKAVDNRELDGLRFLVTSRTDPEIVARCQSFPKDVVCRLQEVPIADVQHDITLYLEASLPKVKDELCRDLSTRAKDLFIYAATVVKMARGTSKTSGSEQESLITRVLEVTSSRQSHPLDDLYAGIVHSAIYHPDEVIRQRRLCVLHTILCELDIQAPTKDLEVICQLSGVAKDVIRVVIGRLHAVMYVADNDSILTYHASFPDFILRSPSSFNSSVYLNPLCDEGLHHAHLTRRCYEIMAERLHFNICNLESSFDLDEDTPDMQSRVKTNIDPVLQYAVQYWMNHLALSRPDEDTLSSIPLCNIPLAFIENIFLYWLEVLHLMPEDSLWRIPMGCTHQWIDKHCSEHIEIWCELIIFWSVLSRELYEHMGNHHRITPHIYLMLSLWKPDLHISRMWRPRFPHLPNVTPDGQRNPTDITRRESQDSKGDTGTDAPCRGDNELVGVPPQRLDCETRWVLSEDGCRVMWLPHICKNHEYGKWALLQRFMIIPELDQISFDLQYLGPNWTRIYAPTSSQ